MEVEANRIKNEERPQLAELRSLCRMLVCPVCRSDLTLITSGIDDILFRCPECQATFPVRNGIPNLMPVVDIKYFANADEWHSSQARLLGWWREERGKSESSSVAKWKPTNSCLQRYLDLDNVNGEGGDLLDIGCGEGQRCRHFFTKKYMGIDPFVHFEQYPFDFIRGVGERLPFRAESFDVVLLVEVLDHVMDPTTVLREALRVLRPNGALFLFIGTHNDGAWEGGIDNGPPIYSTLEKDVHLHHFCVTKLVERLKLGFDRVEYETDTRYTSLWAYSPKNPDNSLAMIK